VVVIDEAAFHDDVAAVIAAAISTRRWSRCRRR
jgi:phage FluMu gp28-like protein